MTIVTSLPHSQFLIKLLSQWPLEQRSLERGPHNLAPHEEWQNQTLVLAISGGADSMALLRAMCELSESSKAKIIVAHLNHHLREDSALDAEFVEQTCESLKIPSVIGNAHIQASEVVSRDGLEGAAREARYEFLQQVATDYHASFVVTAHTLNDQVETILHRVLRGTGMPGLAGIPFERPLGNTALVRPMLNCSREEVNQYLNELGQPYREDASNQQLEFTRNRIRLELLPYLKENFNSNIDQALLQLSHLAAQTQSVVDFQVKALYEESVYSAFPARHFVSVNCTVLANHPEHLLRELLIHLWKAHNWPRQSMGYTQWSRLAQMILESGTTQEMFPGNIQAKKQGEQLMLTHLE